MCVYLSLSIHIYIYIYTPPPIPTIGPLGAIGAQLRLQRFKQRVSASE